MLSSVSLTGRNTAPDTKYFNWWCKRVTGGFIPKSENICCGETRNCFHFSWYKHTMGMLRWQYHRVSLFESRTVLAAVLSICDGVGKGTGYPLNFTRYQIGRSLQISLNEPWCYFSWYTWSINHDSWHFLCLHQDNHITFEHNFNILQRSTNDRAVPCMYIIDGLCRFLIIENRQIVEYDNLDCFAQCLDTN